jgi:hypothetical protein
MKTTRSGKSSWLFKAARLVLAAAVVCWGLALRAEAADSENPFADAPGGVAEPSGTTDSSGGPEPFVNPFGGGDPPTAAPAETTEDFGNPFGAQSPVAAEPAAPGALPTPSADPFQSMYGSGVTASIEAAESLVPAVVEESASDAPETIGEAEGSPQYSEINLMRSLMAAQRYEELKGAAAEYAANYPESGMGWFFTEMARTRRQTLIAREEGGQFFLAQFRALNPDYVPPEPETQIASLPPAMPGEPSGTPAPAPGGETATPIPEPGVSPATPVDPSVEQPAATPAPAQGAARPPSAPIEFEDEKPWWAAYVQPVGYGAAVLIVVFVGFVAVRRRKKKGEGEVDVYGDALAGSESSAGASSAQPTAQEMAAIDPLGAPDISAGEVDDDLFGGAEADLLADEELPEPEPPLAAEPDEPVLADVSSEVDIPVSDDSFPDIDLDGGQIEGAPTPTGGLMDGGPESDTGQESDSDILSFDLGLEEEMPAGPETIGSPDETPLPAQAAGGAADSELGIDDLLSFIPDEGSTDTSVEGKRDTTTDGLGPKPEDLVKPTSESTGGTLSDSDSNLNLSDLVSPSDTPIEASPAADSTGGLSLDDLFPADAAEGPTVPAGASPGPAPSKTDPTQTEGFNQQFEDIMFQSQTGGETKDADTGTGAETLDSRPAKEDSQSQTVESFPDLDVHGLDKPFEGASTESPTDPPGSDESEEIDSKEDTLQGTPFDVSSASTVHEGAVPELDTTAPEKHKDTANGFGEQTTPPSGVPIPGDLPPTPAPERSQALYESEMDKGSRAVEEGNYQEAVRHFSVATALRPDSQASRERLREARRLRDQEAGK